MFFQKIRIESFRNLAPQTVELGKGTNIFVGDNGQGKTNFLETIFFLCNANSFRTNRTEHFVSTEDVDKPVHVQANLLMQERDYKLDFHIQQQRKSFFVNDKRVSHAKFAASLPCILFSPESLGVIKSGPSERRDLIDETILFSSPKNVDILANWQKCLKNRNAILKSILSEKISRVEGIRYLESLNPQFLRAAAEVTALRLQVIFEMSPLVQNIWQEITQSQNVNISVEYVVSDEVIKNWDQQTAYNALNKRRMELATAELSSGTSLIGPHKHDIRFLFNYSDSRYYCSQGQQRALILAYKMAQIVFYKKLHDMWPMLLLDDVLSELDEQKRRHLIEFLKKSEGQTLITTTDVTSLEDLTSRETEVFHVKSGAIQCLR